MRKIQKFTLSLLRNVGYRVVNLPDPDYRIGKLQNNRVRFIPL